MTPERWEQVSALCHAALERSEGERERFLRDACGGDEALHQEVRSLLRLKSAASTFLERPALEAVAPLSSSETDAPAAVGRSSRLHPFQALVVAASALAFAAAVVAGTAIWRHGAQQQDLGWETRGRSPIVSAVAPGGPADGKLQVGDRLIAIDDDPRVAELGVTWKSRFLLPDRPYRVEVDRGGARYQATLQYHLVDFGDRPLLFSRLLVALAWMLVGLLIGLARPSLAGARLMAFTGLGIGLELTRAAMFPLLPVVGDASARLYGLMLLTRSALAVLPYHALYRFPPGVPPGRFWSAALVGLYGVAGVHVVVSILMGTKYIAGPETGLRLERTLNPFGFQPPIVSSALLACTAIMTSAVAARNLRTVSDPDQRRRVKWILFATLVAGASFATNAVLVPTGTGTMDVVSDLTSLVVPMALTYGILRHRVFDISVIVRIGIQYLLARNALRAVIAIPLVVMVFSLAANPDLTVRDILFGRPVFSLLIVAAAAALGFRRRLTTAIDRRFFREAFDRERLLQAILGDIDAFETSHMGIKQVVDRLDGALHPTMIQVWFTSGERERLHLSHSHGSQSAHSTSECQLPAPLVHLLEHDAAATAVSRLEADGVVGGVRRQLEDLGVEVVIPMTGRDGRLRGALMLGLKRSEEPYTPADLGLLQRIARQLGAVREHGELRSRMDEDRRIRQEVLGHIGDRRISLLKECPRCHACYDSDRQRCDVDGAELTLSLPIERTVAGRYRLTRLIGHGGMGAVYEATDERLRRQVAIKVMLGRNFGNHDALRRFDREARAVARLSHPNIISVFDYGPLAGQGAFLVMEYVDGVTLRAALAAAPAYPPPQCLAWIEQLLDAVAVAHAHGVVHRDLKPENVLIVARSDAPERVTVLDFGLATFRGAAGNETDSVSAPGMLLGTLAYMAPEQMLGHAVDQRADVFSLGVMIFEMLTGERPFSSNPVTRGADISRGVSNEAFGDRRLRESVARFLAADPAHRFATVGDSRSVIPLLADYLARHQSAGSASR